MLIPILITRVMHVHMIIHSVMAWESDQCRMELYTWSGCHSPKLSPPIHHAGITLHRASEGEVGAQASVGEWAVL